jgi:hypothetical protein
MWRAMLAEGAAVAILLFILIGGRVAAFLTGFLANNQVARGHSVSWVMANWYLPMGLIKVVYPVAGIGSLMFLGVRRRGFRFLDALILLSLALGFYGLLNSTSGHRILGLVTVIAIGYYIDVLLPDSRWNRIAIAANAMAIVISGARPLVAGVTTSRPSNGAQIFQQVESIHPSRTIVDEWSLRYVFGYRLLPGMIAIDFGDRPGCHGTPVVSKKYPDECWVLSAQSVYNFSLVDHGMPLPRFASIAGKRIGGWITDAGDIGVSPPGQ